MFASRSQGTAGGRSSRGARALAGLSALPAKRWFAYPAVLLVQLRAMWGIWRADLSGGDTSSYFANSELWSNDLMVNLAWSPLYTAFLGTIDWLAGSPVAAVQLHRVLIVAALALLVLGLLRRLVPPWAALIGACWWASLPIVFDSLYEVHLFAALPLLIAILLLTNDPSLGRRGASVGLLLASAVLVRNEVGLIAILLLAAMAVAGWRARSRGDGLPVKRIAIAFGIPVLAAAALLGIAYERSAVQGEQLNDALERKHTLNVCQAFTYSFQERNPERFTGSPWTGCQDLVASVFDEPQPSFTDAWRQNPGQMLDYTTWNLRLLPHGLQVALFNATAGNLNPDYARSQLNAWWAGVLSLLLAILLIAGAAALRRDWSLWRARLYRQRWAWAALGAIAITVLAVIILSQRPRPSYMFGLTLGIIACAALAAAVLARRYGGWRWLAAGSALLPAALLIVLPVTYGDRPTPLTDAYERLSDATDEGSTEGRSADRVLVSSVLAPVLCNYLGPRGSCEGLDYAATVEQAPAGRPIGEILDERGATVLYIDHRARWDQRLRRFVGEHQGWEIVGSGTTGEGPWVSMVRADQ